MSYNYDFDPRDLEGQSGQEWLDQQEAETQTDYLADLSQGSDPVEALMNWLEAAPSSGWTHQGVLNGGEEFWYENGFQWGESWYTVAVHIHPTGANIGDWGGAWVYGIPNSGISVFGNLANRGALEAAVGALGWSIN